MAHLVDFRDYYLQTLETSTVAEAKSFLAEAKIAVLFSSMKQIILLNSEFLQVPDSLTLRIIAFIFFYKWQFYLSLLSNNFIRV